MQYGVPNQIDLRNYIETIFGLRTTSRRGTQDHTRDQLDQAVRKYNETAKEIIESVGR